MKFTLLLVLFSFAADACYSQGHVIVQDRKKNVYLADVQSQAADTLERAYADRVAGGRLVSSGTVRISYKTGKDTIAKDYNVTSGTLKERKPAFVLSSRSSKLNTYTCTYDKAYTVRTNNSNGTVYVYKKDDLLSTYSPYYGGVVPAYISSVPTDIDIPAGTLLIEEQISPNSFVCGNVKTSVKEISFMSGEELWKQEKASAAFYSPAKDYINFTGNYKKGSSAGRAAYTERKSRKVKYFPAKSALSFWL